MSTVKDASTFIQTNRYFLRMEVCDMLLHILYKKNPFVSWKLATWHYFAHRNLVSIWVIRINPTFWMGKLWQKKIAGAVELPRAIQPTLDSESISCTCWVLRGRYCPETPLQAPIRRLCLLTSLQAAWRSFSSYGIGIPGRSIVQRMLVCLVSSFKGPVFMRHLYSHHGYWMLMTQQMSRDMSIKWRLWRIARVW